MVQTKSTRGEAKYPAGLLSSGQARELVKKPANPGGFRNGHTGNGLTITLTRMGTGQWSLIVIISTAVWWACFDWTCCQETAACR